MLNIDKEQRVNVWEIENKGKFSVVRMSSSRKDKKTEEYKNSNWSFVRFVGQAHDKIESLNLKPKDRIVLKGAGISLEPYEDENGETKYPKNPQITVFNWEYLDKSGTSVDTAPVIENAPEQENDDIPF